MSEIKHSTYELLYELLKGLEEAKEGIKSRDSALLKVSAERDKLRDSLNKALEDRDRLSAEVGREIAMKEAHENNRRTLAELVRVLEIKGVVIHYRDLVGHVQKLKDELKKEQSKNVGYVYVTEPEGIARAQGRKLERERIMQLIKDRQGAHIHHSLRCDACTEDEGLFSLLEKGEW